MSAVVAPSVIDGYPAPERPARPAETPTAAQAGRLRRATRDYPNSPATAVPILASGGG